MYKESESYVFGNFFLTCNSFYLIHQAFQINFLVACKTKFNQRKTVTRTQKKDTQDKKSFFFFRSPFYLRFIVPEDDQSK